MAQRIVIDPVTRIEGHLAIKIEVENGTVAEARVSGEMFRGFETILRGREPLDAQQITQRICGVCPVEHGVASVLAQESAYGCTPPDNGRLMRNLIQAGNFIASHITHFYLLSALDFIDVAAIAEYKGTDPSLVALRDWVKAELASKRILPAAPFLPRYAAEYVKDPALNFLALRHYLDALEMRRLAHKMVASFAGKVPHVAAIVPGGMTERVTALKIANCRSFISRLQTFVRESYVPDVLAVAQAFPAYFNLGRGPGQFLAYGVFGQSADPADRFLCGGVLRGGELLPLDAGKITEDVASSWFSSPSGLKPEAGETHPAPDKAGAYSWLKAPRYEGQVVEVGPLARVLINYTAGKNPALKAAVDGLLARLGKQPDALLSVMGRHAARALECQLVVDQCALWIDQLVPEQPAFKDYTIPASGRGMGLTEAARGALGHWIELKGGKIGNYQCVVPTTWNCSPRDDRGNLGAVEQALLGTPIADPENPIEAARVVRSFDPCLACAVH
jgi:ferredoxin hydrogenase large subunit/hydrogenase large subunit